MLIPGTVLQSRYRIIRQIGGGGQALVYLAEDTNLGDLRAIKELTHDPNASPQDRQAAYDQFQREARVLARLNHPNLARVWDHFRVGDNAYLIMDYVDGQTLEEIVDQTSGFLPEAAVQRWAGQLCDVLDYLHGQRPPVIFRDLKPANVMLDRSDTVKLIDFGIVRFFKPGKKTDTLRMGTMGYAPPEQYEGQGQTDARSDIYSLGALLHHLLTKRDPTQHPPFSFPSAPPRSLNPAVSPHVEAAVTKALAYDRVQRFQSASEMKRALTGAVRAPTPTTTIPPPAARPWIELRWPLLGLAAVFVVVIWFLVGRGEPAPLPTPTVASTVVLATNTAISMQTPTVAPTNTATVAAVATPVPDQVQVPDLVGLSQEEAQRLVEEAGLNLAVVGERHDSSIPVLNIITQTIPAGQMARQGETIGVVISQGPNFITVPAVEGLAITAAEPGLREMSLDISQKGVWSKEAEGTILSQDPPASSIVSAGSVVTLIVSSGPRLMLNVNLDNKVLLVACDLEDDSLEPGEALRLVLYWRALQQIPEDYTVYVHMARADGSTLIRRDVQPRDGTHPTSSWVIGELVRDPHELSIPSDALSDIYWLKVVMYSQATMKRLPVVDPGEATVLDDSVLVKELRVVRAQALPTAATEGELIWEKDDSIMVHVPAGEFLMGSKDDPDADDDEHPQHTVYVSEFWIDKTEVTNAQYRKCVEAGTCRVPTTCDWGEPTYSDSSKADHPVVCVSWEDAKAYCEWAGKRLPTEAEWEKAARGTDGRKYPWGNSFDGTKVNFCDANCEFDWKDSGADDGYQRTAPVGSHPEGASPYGTLDMAGNAWEWCQDWFDADYYANSPQRDPQGPSSESSRVVRGGSWYHDERDVRAASRNWYVPDDRYNTISFRCVSQSP